MSLAVTRYVSILICAVVPRANHVRTTFLCHRDIVGQYGVGNWKAILNDPELKFDSRSPVDLKDR